MVEPLSPRNAEVARLRALTRERRARHEAGRFVVEGVKLVAEAIESDLVVMDVYADGEWHPDDDMRRLLADDDLPITAVSTRGLERIASTTSPQPVVAEVKIPQWDWSDLPSEPSVLVAVDINDPGNVGTLTRSAIAAGFDAVICLGDTADPFAPKVVRSSAGALFAVPVIVERDTVAGLEALGRLGVDRYGTRMSDADACDEVVLTGAVALVLGSEAHGLGDDHGEYIDHWLTIPMAGATESLNVAMAGTILTYEVARQRRVAARN